MQRYIDGFNQSDHKDAFDKEINNDAFTGNPTVTITRMTEENETRSRWRKERSSD